MTLQKKCTKKSAFTILELLLAATIIAVVLCVLLLQYISATQLVANSRNLTRAITHAQYVMENIKDVTFSSIASQINAGTWDWATADVTANGLIALASEAIDSQVSGTDLLDVTVTVSWQDRGGRARSFSLETLIAEP